MASTRFAFLSALLAALVVLPRVDAQNRIDAAFQKFWAAHSPEEAARAAGDIAKSGVTFDEALRRLKAGRAYGPAAAGVVKLSHKINGVEHFYAVNVPANYDPAKRYQVRFQLHGGVAGRDSNQPRGAGEIGALSGAEQFYVIPYAWNDAPWWSDDQALNLERIVDSLKRLYNIDENRVAAAGVSDGGTGAYFIAMRSTTPYASFLPLNAFIMVLANGDIDDGRNFPNNLRNKPLFVINGGRDRLYPISNVEPFTRHLMGAGIEIDYHPQPNGEHNTAWWPEMKDPFEKFVAAHPREPHPGRLTWETTDSLHNRAHWLVIDALGAQASDTPFADPNIMRDAAGVFPLFSRSKMAGRVDLVCIGNSVEAKTRGVAAFTLLLAPDKFDFSQPVEVVVNGHVAFEGRVQPSLETLLKWAARDNDRTMLYGAELKIKVSAL